jgi:hypothetical protein
MEGIERIKKASRRLRGMCLILFWFTPVAVALGWIFIEYIPLSQLNLPIPPNPDHPMIVRFWGFLISMLPAGVAMYALWKLRRLFGLYALGMIFEAGNVECYRALGRAAVYWVIAQFISIPLHGIALSWFNPPGQRLLVLSMDSEMLAGLFIGAATLTIAWVMDEGRKINEEQALIV